MPAEQMVWQARRRNIKRVTGTYRYYLTKAGRAATAAAERIIEAVVVPVMI